MKKFLALFAVVVVTVGILAVSYTHLDVYKRQDFMIVQQDASIDYPFKIGYNNRQGWLSYVNGNTVLSKRYRCV